MTKTELDILLAISVTPLTNNGEDIETSASGEDIQAAVMAMLKEHSRLTVENNHFRDLLFKTLSNLAVVEEDGRGYVHPNRGWYIVDRPANKYLHKDNVWYVGIQDDITGFWPTQAEAEDFKKEHILAELGMAKSQDS